VFLFCRDYLEYHADRCSDFSLLIYRGSQLVGVMPAKRVEGSVISHGDLTFGGVISDARMTTKLILEVFSTLSGELRARGSKGPIFKAIPHTYRTVRAEEYLCAHFLNRPKLFRRDISSTVAAGRRLRHPTNRNRVLAQPNPIAERWIESAISPRSWQLPRPISLARYGARPVHTAAGMQLLAVRFPEK
jgi:hypothetical protein